MLYSDDFRFVINWLFISSVIMNNCSCSMNYSFETGFGYVPFSSLKLNFNESKKNFLPHVFENNKILLVLDASENMYSQNRIYKLKHALRHWIHSIPEDLMIGLAQFNDFAHPLINVSSVSERLKAKFLDAIPIIAEGGCCIGCAVKCAIQMLGADEKGSTVILITDGRNTVPGEDVKDVLSLVSSTKIKINTISLGDAADDLEHLAWTTGGRTYSVQDQQGLLMLTGALFDSLNGVLGKTLQIANVFEAEISNKDKKIHNDFVIDSALPIPTLSIYYGPEQGLDELVLNSSESYMMTKDFEEWDKSNRYLAQTLQEGLWTISLTYNSINKYAAVFVSSGLLTSELKTNAKIHMMCWHNAEAGPVNTNLKPVAVYATVSNEDHHFVFDLNISAILYAPDGTMTKIDLWDNGSGADEVKNDGTYSRFLAIISMTGRYTLKFEAIGMYRTTVEGSEKMSSEVKPFSRICKTNSFKVISAASIYPPSCINDLKIVESNKTFVNICWTAPGKHLDWGKVDKYMIKYIRMESCPHMFQTNLSVWTAEVVAPVLTHPSGKPECLALNYTPYLSFNTCLCLSMYAKVEEGLSGPLSNVVQIYCPTINDTKENSSVEETPFFQTSDTCCTEESTVTTISDMPRSTIISETINDQTLWPNKSRNQTGIETQETSNFPFVPLITVLVILLIIIGGLLILRKWNKLRNVCVSHSYNVYRAKYKQRKSHLVTYTSVESVSPEATD
ncbi:calcium-activated chloride channel regulator 1-like [Schistocerca americana]|uniref:calcium-activated chloride channel regulator 1-like n=1 Tax=Schistocerca americana TaxID=7009 RepID=UPI001F4F4C76|nr:calcium-activated chloride channel regulator 1-like [Schistocerca americana]